MRLRYSITKISTVFALVVLATTGAIWEVRHVRALGPPEPDRFGMVGITPGQTLRLNVVNLAMPSNRQFPPDPCRVVLSFRDAAGHAFTNSDGQPIRNVVELQAGESAFLDLNGDMFGGPSTNADIAPGRLQLRPFVRVLSTPPDPERQSSNVCFPTMEVFDNASGRTSLFAAGFIPPPDPDRRQ